MTTLPNRFVVQQSAELLRLGVNPIDVERSIAWLEAHLPEGADPATWLPTAGDLWTEPQAQVIDSRAAWYADVPMKWRRLLDAR